MPDEKTKAPPELIQALVELIGRDYVFTSLPERLAHGRGTWPVEFKRAQLNDWRELPAVVVYPASIEEVQGLIRLARQHRIPLVPFGGGSGIVGGSVLNDCLLVDLKRLDQVHLNRANQTVEVGAGVICAHLEEFLQQQGHTCGHFPQSMHSATIGGMVATSAVGTFSGKYGKMDDLVVGLEVVLGDGRILNTSAIPRRSTGPDLNRLLIGSEGTLGVITSAVLKIWPAPQARRWAAYTFPDTHSGLQAVRDFMGSDAQPACVRLYDEAESDSYLRRFDLKSGQALLILGFEGDAGLVDWQALMSNEFCLAAGGAPQAEAVAQDWFRRRFDTTAMLRTNRSPGGVADAIEVAATWEDLEAVWRGMRAALEPLCFAVHCHFSHVYHSSGSVYVIFYAEAPQGTPEAAIALYDRCLTAALEACLKAGGSISHHHGVGRAKSAWMQAEHGDVNFDLLLALKRTLDSDGLLNPGALGLSL